MPGEPQVSICIPSYNNEEFIALTLQSVLGQTFGDFELVVVDDCSTDRTVSIVRTFRDSRFRLLQNPRNLGMSPNWNKALSCARGKYVKLLCGDDLLHPQCLVRQVEVLDKLAASGVVLALCNRTIINGENNVVLQRGFPHPAGQIPGPRLIRKSVRWGSNLIGEPAVGLFRRDAMSQINVGGVNPYTLDLELWSQLLKCGDAFIDKSILASFRISPGASTTKVGLRQAACFRGFVRTVRKDPFYGINAFDVISASALSFVWCALRNVFIRAHSRSAGFQPAVSPISNRHAVKDVPSELRGKHSQAANLRYEAGKV